MARTSGILLAALLATVSSGCYDQGAGVEPPLDRIYFPTGLAISPGETRLYVANSDFDLQYNGGVLQSFDLVRIREIVPKWCDADSDCSGDQRCDLEPSPENRQKPSHWCVALSGSRAGRPCGPYGEKSTPSKLLFPGRCGYVSTTHPQDGGSSLIVSEVGIGAFATDVIYRKRPTGPGGRLFVPVRGDATLHFIDTIDEEEEPVPFELACGQNGNAGDCDDSHRRGKDPAEENTRNLRLPSEPFGIAATADGEAIVITHQTEGAASLFVNDDESWGDGVSSFGVGPKLEFVVGGMPQRPIGIAALPEPAIVKENPKEYPYDPGFLVTFRDAPQINLLRYYDDAGGSPPRPFMQVAGVTGITANSVNFDSRGIALDPAARQAAEKLCDAKSGQERKDCLATAAGVPVAVYVANRTPSSMLVGETRPNQSPTSSDDLPHIPESVPLPFGPSRVVIGSVIDLQGQLASRTFAVCFDSGLISIYDPKKHQIEKWIETGRGPHGFAIDVGKYPDGSPYAFAYVAHFTDSYLGVVDLDQRHGTFGSIIATIGRPSPPRASK